VQTVRGQARIVVASVDYRLAPEHRFPEPLDDCYRALTWLVEHPTVDPARVGDRRWQRGRRFGRGTGATGP